MKVEMDTGATVLLAIVLGFVTQGWAAPITAFVFMSLLALMVKSNQRRRTKKREDYYAIRSDADYRRWQNKYPEERSW